MRASAQQNFLEHNYAQIPIKKGPEKKKKTKKTIFFLAPKKTKIKILYFFGPWAQKN